MKFPSLLRVQVRNGTQVLPNVLIWINTRVWGQDYYRGQVGITDASGFAVLTREELVKQFRENRKLFPMDYKLPLEDCDDEIVVGIEGGREFVHHRETALGSTLVTPSAKERWAIADNARLKRVMMIVPIPGGARELVVTLSAESSTSPPSA